MSGKNWAWAPDGESAGMSHGEAEDPEFFFCPRRKWQVFVERLVFFHGRFFVWAQKEKQEGNLMGRMCWCLPAQDAIVANGFRLRLLKMFHKPDGDWYPGWQVNRKNMIVFGLQKCHETHLQN